MQLAADTVGGTFHITGVQVHHAAQTVAELGTGGSQSLSGSVGRGSGSGHHALRQGRVCTQGHDGKVGHHTAAHDKGSTPDKVGPGAGLQTTHIHVHRGSTGNDKAAGRHGKVKVHGNHAGTGVNHSGGGHTHQNQQVHESHDNAGHTIVAFLQELGNGEHAALQQHGQEGEGHNHQNDGGKPFIASDSQTQPVGGLTAHTHELLRGNVGSQQGETHEPPAQATAGQEVVGSALFLLLFSGFGRVAGFPDTQTDYTHHNHAEDNHFPQGKHVLRRGGNGGLLGHGAATHERKRAQHCQYVFHKIH